MRTVDRRCIYLSRLEVKEILLKHLCEANPGYEPAFQDQLGDTVDLGDLPPEIEVQLTPKPAVMTVVGSIRGIEVVPGDPDRGLGA